MGDVRDAARRWADTWRTSWERLEADPIAALYAENASYSTGPFRTPYRGPAGAREYATGTFERERHVQAWFGEPVVDADRAAVTWWATLLEDGRAITLAGTSVLRFDADGRVVDEWDAWNMAEGHVGPPPWDQAR